MTVPEDRISCALRAGRISRWRAWRERSKCDHKAHGRYRERPAKFSNGIDTWTNFQVGFCKRCGALMYTHSETTHWWTWDANDTRRYGIEVT
jgi:hypothetical protein